MKKFYLLTLISLAVLFVANAQTRMTGPFSKLTINSPLTLVIIAGNEEKVTLETEEPAFASFLNINSNGSELVVETKNKPKNMNEKATLTVYCKSLTNLVVNKQSTITIPNKLSSTKLNIELNDRSQIESGNFAVSTLTINAKGESKASIMVENGGSVEVATKGKSDVTISGASQKLYVNAASFSTVDASGLQASKIALDCNENSTITILSNGMFDANVNNNGKVQVKGNGQLNKKNIKNGGSVVQL